MEDKEIQYFTDGLKLVSNEFYLDAIHKFNMLIEEFPESDLADDSLFNIGLCLFKMKQFEMAIKSFQQVISSYPEATISSLVNENVSGKTAAKCYYCVFISQLALGLKDEASQTIYDLKKYSDNTFIIINNEKLTYAELAEIVFNSL